jgi:hypothetical protein
LAASSSRTAVRRRIVFGEFHEELGQALRPQGFEIVAVQFLFEAIAVFSSNRDTNSTVAIPTNVPTARRVGRQRLPWLFRRSPGILRVDCLMKNDLSNSIPKMGIEFSS